MKAVLQSGVWAQSQNLLLTHIHLILKSFSGIFLLMDLFTFPRKNCMKVINTEDFDFFFVLFDRRFSSHDGWLTEILSKMKKPLFFVRTKFDKAVEEQCGTHTEEEVHSNILKDARRSLKALNLHQCPIYVISNLEPERFEFPHLMDEVLLALPSHKVKAMVFTLGNFCSSFIAQKKKFLKSRIWKPASMSAAGGAIPIQGSDIVVDTAVLVMEIDFYIKQFGLDNESLRQLAESTGSSVKYYQDAIIKAKEVCLTRDYVATGVKAYIRERASGREYPKEFDRFLPVVDTMIQAGSSFGAAYYILDKIIDDLSADAARS
ncbi:interferon-inducible GTPase 5-like [Liolophura sinensis]|uniref:interferon-inducible GTPase 5-like n=1 Tax=Liolophura sinensis TaxID=3198878 RepID=UPI0031580D15